LALIQINFMNEPKPRAGSFPDQLFDEEQPMEPSHTAINPSEYGVALLCDLLLKGGAAVSYQERDALGLR
jgi:hypothetical protein